MKITLKYFLVNLALLCVFRPGISDTQLPQVSYPKWLAIGNSITAHAPKAELQWDGETRGMAASSVETDYVHTLQRMIQAKDTKSAVELKIAGRSGRLSGGTIEQINAELTEFRDWKADLITIQLGENERLAELGAGEFERRYRALVDGLLSGENKPVVVCTGVWDPNAPLDSIHSNRYREGRQARIKDDIIEKICREKQLLFVSIAPYAAIPSNHGDGNSDGVRWHPNDAGMKAYAQAIFTALYGK